MSNNAFDLRVTFKSNKADRAEEVEFFHELPYESQVAIIRYGAQRFINDKLGGADLGQAEASEKFDTILAQLKQGWQDQRGTGTGRPAMSPLEKEIQTLAKGRLRDALKTKGIPLKQVSKEKQAQLVEQIIEKGGQEMRDKAEAILRAKQTKVPSADIDLGDLDL